MSQSTVPRTSFLSDGNLTASHGLFISKKDGHRIQIVVDDAHPGIRKDILTPDVVELLKFPRNVLTEAILDGVLDCTELNTIQGTGLIQGLAYVDFVDMAEAVRTSELLSITAPAGDAQTFFLGQMSQHDLRGIHLLAEPDNEIMINARLRLFRSKLPKSIIGTASAPFATRRKFKLVDTSGIKDYLPIATNATGPLLDEVKAVAASVYPPEVQLAWGDFVDLIIDNINPWIHLPSMVAGRPDLDNGVLDRLFYAHWVVLASDRIEMLDLTVRRSLRRVMGRKDTRLMDEAIKMYKEVREMVPKPETWGEVGRNSPVHNKIKAPTTKEHRYNTEEPHHFDIIVSLCRVYGVDPQPVLDLVAEAEDWLERSLVTWGKMWTDLGLDGAPKERCVEVLNGTDLV